MAPMTRTRASDEGVPTELMALYYAQRASAGPDHHRVHCRFSPRARDHPRAGIYNDEQVRAGGASFAR
jgi:N-ethylmaleimide reductase